MGGYFLWLLFGFNGRLSRTNYRYCRIAANLSFLLAIYPLFLGIQRNTGNLGLELMLALVAMALSGLMMWTTLAMQVKRLHDRDKSWPWVLIGVIPLIGPPWLLIETCFLPGTPGYNRFEDTSEDLGAAFA